MELMRNMGFRVPKNLDLLKDRMLHFYRKPVISSLHWASLEALKRMGLSWEQYDHGDTSLGVLSYSRAPISRDRKPNRRLVIVPGYGDTALSWLPVLLGTKYARTFNEWMILDFPGYGGFLSAKSPFKTFQGLSHSVTGLLETLRPTTVIGHSLGGWLAAKALIYMQQMKSKNARNFEQLVLINPAGVLGEGQLRSAHEKLLLEIQELGYEALKYRMFNKTPIGFKWLERDARNVINSPEMKAFLGSIEEKDFLDTEIPKLAGEVSLIWGKHDTLIPESMRRIWLSKLQSATVSLQLLPSGHSPHVEALSALKSSLLATEF